MIERPLHLRLPRYRRLSTANDQCQRFCFNTPHRKLSDDAFPGRTAEQRKSVVFSGIQPTGIPHIGNYIGALRQWVRMQNEQPEDTILLYSIADLHAITVPQFPNTLQRWRRESFAALLAVGLDPRRSIIFSQSTVSAHTELMWILSCTASMGYLSRMTQWKSRTSLASESSPADLENRRSLKLGLFSYPVLQAADILVHRTTHVPVGDDQVQHLEFARECAINFNHAYGDVLSIPKTVTKPVSRIMSLKQPLMKMSKSNKDPKSKILITDSDDEIREKIKGALTDSEPHVTYEPQRRPGVANLIRIGSQFDDASTTCESVAARFKSATLRDLKDWVADRIISELAGIRVNYLRLTSADEGLYIDSVAASGTKRARLNADATMATVRDAIGISS